MSELNNNTIRLQGVLDLLLSKGTPEGGGSANINWGTFTLDARTNTNTVPIEHGLGVTPDLLICFYTGRSSQASKGGPFFHADLKNGARYSMSGSDLQKAFIEEADKASWANDTTFLMNYAFWYYPAGQIVWVAIKQ